MGLSPGGEDADALAQAPVEAVGARVEQLENPLGALEAGLQGLVEGAADGAGGVPEDPVVLLVVEEFLLEGVALQKVFEERPPAGLGDHQNGVVVAGAEDLDEALPRRQRLGVRQDVGVPLKILAEQLGQFLIEGHRLLVGQGPQEPPVEAPDGLVALAVLGVGVLLELAQQVIEEGALARSRRPLEDIDLVLLGAPFEGLHQADQAVGEEPVGEKGLVGALHEQAFAVVVDVVDGLRVVGVLVDALPDIGLDHVVKDLENVADHPSGVCGQLLQEGLEGNGVVLVGLADAVVEVMQRVLDVVHR